MIKIKKSSLITIIIASVIGAVLIAGGIGYGLMAANGVTLVNREKYETYEEIAEKYGKLYRLQTMIENNYLWEVDEESQMDSVYKALVSSLGDKYSAYYDAEETE